MSAEVPDQPDTRTLQRVSVGRGERIGTNTTPMPAHVEVYDDNGTIVRSVVHIDMHDEHGQVVRYLLSPTQARYFAIALVDSASRAHQ